MERARAWADPAARGWPGVESSNHQNGRSHGPTLLLVSRWRLEESGIGPGSFEAYQELDGDQPSLRRPQNMLGI